MHQNARSRLRIRADGAVRYAMVHTMSSVLPLYIINEYPKSGGSWLGQMLSEALHVPFPRNRGPVLRSSIMHGHYLQKWGMRNVIVLWRDGRDVMVSSYYHSFFLNERENAPLVRATRKELQFDDYRDVSTNLPTFIEYAFTRRRHPRFTWSAFVDKWAADTGVIHSRYEDLLNDTAAELSRIVAALTGSRLDSGCSASIAKEFSFSRQSGRQPGTESTTSFMRKGVAGDWQNCFSDAARQVFHQYAGRQLIALGYEPDDTWAK